MRPFCRKLAWVPIFLVPLCSAGCTTAPAGPPKHVRNWDQLRRGMTKQQVIALLGDAPDQAGPMTIGTQPATSPLEIIARAVILEAFDGRYERWHYGEFELAENILAWSRACRGALTRVGNTMIDSNEAYASGDAGRVAVIC